MKKVVAWLRLTFFFIFAAISSSYADEIRPAYLEVKENADGVYSVLWKLPAKVKTSMRLFPHFHVLCVDRTEVMTQQINAAFIQRWIMACDESLQNKFISISGLEVCNTDVLIHLELLNGESHTTQLTGSNNLYQIPQAATSWQLIKTYTWLGIEHILLGFDHLLFVFALLLIESNVRQLLFTITAFTIAHSFTLAAASLGYMHIPQQPVEAVIALSIIFLAVEIVHGRQGKPGYAARWPWLVAFMFGLLHGFGFAGALAEIGLPQQAIPLALVFFNAGVELGQLLFVLIVLSGFYVLRQLQRPKLLAKVEMIATYFIGGLASFWFIERLSSF